MINPGYQLSQASLANSLMQNGEMDPASAAPAMQGPLATADALYRRRSGSLNSQSSMGGGSTRSPLASSLMGHQQSFNQGQQIRVNDAGAEADQVMNQQYAALSQGQMPQQQQQHSHGRVINAPSPSMQPRMMIPQGSAQQQQPVAQPAPAAPVAHSGNERDQTDFPEQQQQAPQADPSQPQAGKDWVVQVLRDGNASYAHTNGKGQFTHEDQNPEEEAPGSSGNPLFDNLNDQQRGELRGLQQAGVPDSRVAENALQMNRTPKSASPKEADWNKQQEQNKFMYSHTDQAIKNFIATHTQFGTFNAGADAGEFDQLKAAHKQSFDNLLNPSSAVGGTANPKQQQQKQLSAAAAQDMLKQAGGDKNKARQLAQQQGFSL